jgi:hypothetical protein
VEDAEAAGELEGADDGQGGRLDPFILFMTTEGDDDENELAALMARIERVPATEIEQRRPGLTIFRNRPPGCSSSGTRSRPCRRPAGDARRRRRVQAREPGTVADDSSGSGRTSPTRWSTRAQAAGRWISDDKWAECCSTLEIPKNALVTVGVDAARTRDTTACVWSWLSEDGVVVQRSRVWTCVPGRVEAREADVFVPGGRLDNDLVRDFIRYELMRDYAARLLFFDERYFDTQANDLSKDGMTVVEMHQGKPEMVAAWDEFYKAIHTGPKPTLAHNGDPVFNEHRRKANGLKTERGWNVSKKTGDVIDALAAAVMSRYGCIHFGQWKPVSRRPVSW